MDSLLLSLKIHTSIASGRLSKALSFGKFFFHFFFKSLAVFGLVFFLSAS